MDQCHLNRSDLKCLVLLLIAANLKGQNIKKMLTVTKCSVILTEKSVFTIIINHI